MEKNSEKIAVRLEFDAEHVRSIEACSRRTLKQLLTHFVETWFENNRHTMYAAKKVGVAWPVDWYESMLKHWGMYNISTNVRRLLYDKLNTPRNPLPTPISDRDYAPKKMKRSLKPSSGDRNTLIAHVILPLEYVQRLEVEYGDGKVSTGIKSIVFEELKRLGENPSMSRGLKGLVSEAEPRRKSKKS